MVNRCFNLYGSGIKRETCGCAFFAFECAIKSHLVEIIETPLELLDYETFFYTQGIP